MNWRLVQFGIGMWAGADKLPAEVIPIPNGSFESPTTDFVDLNIDSWQEAPKPDWYVEGGGFLWTQLAGTFRNTPPGRFDHIDNCDGDQGAWLFAVPEVALFQDYHSVDWNDAVPTHAFEARFEVEKSYKLTVGVIAGGGGMSNGATAQISLFYRDAASNKVTVAAASITNSPTLFSNRTQFVDFEAHLPVVKADDQWAGQHIGVQILSTVNTNLQGGYWDFDNVRLSSFDSPRLLDTASASGQVTFTLQSEPGLRFEILASTDIAQPLSNWTSVATITNITGSAPFTDPIVNFSQRFYQARQLP